KVTKNFNTIITPPILTLFNKQSKPNKGLTNLKIGLGVRVEGCRQRVVYIVIRLKKCADPPADIF
ncbi:MAG: hypothetical protein J6Y87_09000, partial [Muribaculaceae bacterium]|nr:hypothetical protein [Muribaculaceae bacterium]